MQLPGVLILVNDSVTLSSLNTLATDIGIQPNGLISFTPPGSTIQGIDTQLQITETITFDEFNARVISNPNYPKIVRLNRLRVLVILSDFQNTTNRELFDIVMFIKQGLVSVERCKYGAPGFTLDIQRLNIFNLLFGIKHSKDTVFCFPCEKDFDFDDGYCPPPFPPPICYPQTQTLENPRPPEHLQRRDLELGALELYGVEALETSQGPGRSVFGPRLDGHDENGSGEFAEGDTDGEA
jgi:hypothetical protein